MSDKTPSIERSLIMRGGDKRPYGAKILFQVLHAALIGDAEHVTVLLESGPVATIEPVRSPSWEAGKTYLLKLDGFTTAAIAEASGLRFAQALLMTAISQKFGLRLVYRTREPAVVYERFRSEGFSSYMEGISGRHGVAVVNELANCFQAEAIDRKVLLSMELFCAGALEANARTRFVTTVSALEPLAGQVNLGLEVASYVDQCIALLQSCTEIEPGIRTSMRGRIEGLKRESVRQSLARVAETYFPGNKSAWNRIDRAYELRSELLHNGALSNPDIDLAQQTEAISALLRRIYEVMFGRPLAVPAIV